MCLIPEVPFKLEKLLEYVGEVLDKKGNAVVCVAEGAGQVRGAERLRGAEGRVQSYRTGVWLIRMGATLNDGRARAVGEWAGTGREACLNKRRCGHGVLGWLAPGFALCRLQAAGCVMLHTQVW